MHQQDYSARFWAKVDATGPCWEWTAAIKPNGYGTFALRKGQMRNAHRVAWELLVGPIPEGLVIDHLCRNRRCVNPDHLEPVTPGENVRRGLSGRPSNATTCHQGHPYDYVYPDGRRACRTCQNESKRRSRERARKEHS